MSRIRIITFCSTKNACRSGKFSFNFYLIWIPRKCNSNLFFSGVCLLKILHVLRSEFFFRCCCCLCCTTLPIWKCLIMQPKCRQRFIIAYILKVTLIVNPAWNETLAAKQNQPKKSAFSSNWIQFFFVCVWIIRQPTVVKCTHYSPLTNHRFPIVFSLVLQPYWIDPEISHLYVRRNPVIGETKSFKIQIRSHRLHI